MKTPKSNKHSYEITKEKLEMAYKFSNKTFFIEIQ